MTTVEIIVPRSSIGDIFRSQAIESWLNDAELAGEEVTWQAGTRVEFQTDTSLPEAINRHIIAHFERADLAVMFKLMFA